MHLLSIPGVKSRVSGHLYIVQVEGWDSIEAICLTTSQPGDGTGISIREGGEFLVRSREWRGRRGVWWGYMLITGTANQRAVDNQLTLQVRKYSSCSKSFTASVVHSCMHSPVHSFIRTRMKSTQPERDWEKFSSVAWLLNYSLIFF